MDNMTRGSFQQRDEYWLREKPREARLPWVGLKYYAEVGKLVVSRFYRDQITGAVQEARSGATLSRSEIAGNADALTILLDFCDSIPGVNDDDDPKNPAGD